VKLHLGCFDVPLDGWYNTDITPHIFISRIPFLAYALYRTGKIDSVRYHQHQRGVFRKIHYLDVTRRFPLMDNTIDAVYSSHMLYNLRKEEAEFCVREIFRVLRPGSVVRIAVIDLDELVQRYDGAHPESFLHTIYQPEVARRKNHMQWSYNANSLTALLFSAGFVSIQRMQYRKGNIPDVEAIDYRPDSLFVEGEKPQ